MEKTPQDFLSSSAKPTGASNALLALWHDARGDWERAHELVQEEESPEAYWVHAYLHRKEGDRNNAAYWYRQAGQRPADGSLDTEREMIAAALLQK